MVYIEFEVPTKSAKGIAAFYPEIIGAPAEVLKVEGAPTASVSVGRDQKLRFRETPGKIPEYDGHHMQVYLADFSVPYKRLLERGLISKETDAHEWRFMDIVDLKSN